MNLSDSQLMYGSALILFAANIALFLTRKSYGFASFAIQLAYSAYFFWGLTYDSADGSGLAWWFCFLISNCVHTFALALYFTLRKLRKPKRTW